MKFCSNCGSQIDEAAVICPQCGVPQKNLASSLDSGSFGWAALGFFLPVVGLILFLVWKETKPLSAKKAGIGALVSVILSALLYIALGSSMLALLSL